MWYQWGDHHLTSSQLKRNCISEIFIRGIMWQVVWSSNRYWIVSNIKKPHLALPLPYPTLSLVYPTPSHKKICKNIPWPPTSSNLTQKISWPHQKLRDGLLKSVKIDENMVGVIKYLHFFCKQFHSHSRFQGLMVTNLSNFHKVDILTLYHVWNKITTSYMTSYSILSAWCSS